MEGAVPARIGGGANFLGGEHGGTDKHPDQEERPRAGRDRHQQRGRAQRSGITVIIDSDNVNRGEAVRALKEAEELILEGKWPAF